ncbi:MAG: hypothetical protein EOO89_30390, partial [Pedobacter sp.]
MNFKKSVLPAQGLIATILCIPLLTGCPSDSKPAPQQNPIPPTSSSASSASSVSISSSAASTSDSSSGAASSIAATDCSNFIASTKTGFGNVEPTYSAWFEAEDATHNLIIKTEANEGFEEGTTNGTLLRMEQSGKLFVHWDNLVIKQGGLTEIVIKGAAPWGTKKQKLSIFNEVGVKVITDIALNMESSGDYPKKWAEYKVYVDLPAGNYSLEVNDDWGYVFFDALRLRDQTVVLDGELNVTQVNYVKSNPASMELTINYNHNKLIGFDIDGVPVAYEFNASCDHIVLSKTALMTLTEGNHELHAIFNQGKDFVTTVLVTDNAVVPAERKYEAEKQSIGLGVSVKPDPTASNGSFISNENSGSMEFLVTAPEKGQYDIKM